MSAFVADVGVELATALFGRAYSVYRIFGEEVRLVWDGKDGIGFLERKTGAGEHWETVSPYMARGDLDDVDKVATFQEAVRRFAGRD